MKHTLCRVFSSHTFYKDAVWTFSPFSPTRFRGLLSIKKENCQFNAGTDAVGPVVLVTAAAALPLLLYQER